MELAASRGRRHGHEPARLERRRRLPRMGEALAEHHRRAGQGPVGVAHAHPDHRDIVRVGAGEKARRAGRERRVHRRRDGQGRVLDLDRLQRVLGEVAALGDHEGHRLADVAHDVARDGGLEIPRRPVGNGHAIGDDGRGGHVGRGEHGVDAGHRERAAGVDPHEAGVGVARADHDGLEHALDAHVGHEAAATGEEGLGAQPRQRRADHAAGSAEERTGSVTGGS